MKVLEDFFATQPRVLEWGVVPLGSPLPNAEKLKAWVGSGLHAGLRYMEERLEERQSPSKLFPWAKSAVLFSIQQAVPFGTDTGSFRVASYALGEDYHHVARRILAAAEEHLQKTFEATAGATHGSPLQLPLQFAGFCDTWPVFERDLAAEAGLGWRGKNACVIHKQHGSEFMLAGFFLNVDLESTAVPAQDFCGGCTACLDECPTDALLEPGKLDATKCLSYWTIEAKGEIPAAISEKSGPWIFGCDICQEVCPWNHKHKKAVSSLPKDFLPGDSEEWLGLLRKGGGFQSRFKNTPLLRAGRRSLLRNVLIALRHIPDFQAENLPKEFVDDETDSVILSEFEHTREFLGKKNAD